MIQELINFIAPMRDATNRRLLFVKYARAKGFDPYIAENWYRQPQEDIMLFKVFTCFHSSFLTYGSL